MQANQGQTEQYSQATAQIIATIMVHYNEVCARMDDNQAFNFLHTYNLKAGLKKFGEKGWQAVNKEASQLHNCMVFKPISIDAMTPEERKWAMESLIFLTEK